MKKMLSLIALMGIAASASAVGVVVDDAENAGAYTVAVPAGETLVVNSSSDATQGSASIEPTYTFTAQAAWYKSASAKKTFASPVDFGDMEYFSFDFKAAAGNEKFMFIIYFEDAKGNQARFTDYTIFTNADGTWQRKTYKISDLRKDRWASGGQPVNLEKITSVRYHLTNQAAVEAGSVSYQIDNVEVHNFVGIKNEVVVEGFEYASNAALETAWIDGFGAPVQTLDSDAYEGSYSAAVTAEVPGKWTTRGVTHTFDVPQDYTDIKYVKVAIKGDAVLAGLDPRIQVMLQDETGQRINGMIWDWGGEAEWQTIIMPFADGGVEQWVLNTSNNTWSLAYGGASAWREDDWDDGQANRAATTDLSKVKKIILAYSTQLDASVGTATYPINPTVKYDNLVVGFDAADVPAEDPMAANGWNLYQ
jgi:hypothetical protein